MDRIDLGTTGRKTTRLGYGCSSLMGAMGSKESLAMLETAFDAGIRHFDVAPMYGFGQAESCVGEFLSRHRGEVTVTTKYGIAAAKRQGLIGLARSIARPVVRALPAVKKRLAQVAVLASGPAEKASFTVAQAQASLKSSLANLRTDHIDVWLLHEVERDDLHDEDLLRMLEDSVASGMIGSFGIGSEGARVKDVLQALPQYCRVLQFEWSAMDAPVAGVDSFRIHHRSLAGNFRELRESLERDAKMATRWSGAVGMDLTDREVLAGLMLKVALVQNPESVILVSSKSADHIRRNVAVAGDAALAGPSRRLYQLVQQQVAAPEGISQQVAG